MELSNYIQIYDIYHIIYLKCIALAWVLTAVIFQCEEAKEIVVVQVKLGQRNIRIFNAYGPQELDVSAQTKLNSTIYTCKQ